MFIIVALDCPLDILQKDLEFSNSVHRLEHYLVLSNSVEVECLFKID